MPNKDYPKLRECPFCGGNDLELKDYTENVYGFWDYRIRCKTCRACMDSPPTSYITVYDDRIRQTRNDETKAKAKRELILNWNRGADNEQREKHKMTVYEYRNKHKRCKTCRYANKGQFNGWYCEAKVISHRGILSRSGSKGCFCKLYAVKEL